MLIIPFFGCKSFSGTIQHKNKYNEKDARNLELFAIHSTFNAIFSDSVEYSFADGPPLIRPKLELIFSLRTSGCNMWLESKLNKILKSEFAFRDIVVRNIDQVSITPDGKFVNPVSSEGVLITLVKFEPRRDMSDKFGSRKIKYVPGMIICPEIWWQKFDKKGRLGSQGGWLGSIVQISGQYYVLE
jgi:hypothetical protein